MATIAPSGKTPASKKPPKPAKRGETPTHSHIMRVIEKQRIGDKLIVHRRCLYYPLCHHTDTLEM